MQLVARMYVHPNATLRAMLVGPKRCGVPTMFGSIGTDSAGDDIFALAFEWTTDYAPLPGTNDEQEDVRIVVELWRRSSRVDGQTVTSSRVS